MEYQKLLMSYQLCLPLSHVQLCDAWTIADQAPLTWSSPGSKNTGVGCHAYSRGSTYFRGSSLPGIEPVPPVL